MNDTTVEVDCPRCDGWVEADRSDVRVACECGATFAVTVTLIG